MTIIRLTIDNFRRVQTATIDCAGHALMVGESNAGKSTICGSLDINEHHFHYGRDLEPEVGNRASEVSQYVFGAYPMPPSPLYSVH